MAPVCRRYGGGLECDQQNETTRLGDCVSCALFVASRNVNEQLSVIQGPWSGARSVACATPKLSNHVVHALGVELPLERRAVRAISFATLVVVHSASPARVACGAVPCTSDLRL